MDKTKTFDINKSECVEALTCHKSWPVCLFDYTYKNKVPEYFAIRVKSSSYTVIENYFYAEETSLWDYFYTPNISEKSSDSMVEEAENDLKSPNSHKNGPPNIF